MITEAPSIETNTVSFLNRDHIVLVTITETDIIITTTLGMKLIMPASATILAKFTDDLANHVESNFVSVASSVVSATWD